MAERMIMRDGKWHNYNFIKYDANYTRKHHCWDFKININRLEWIVFSGKFSSDMTASPPPSFSENCHNCQHQASWLWNLKWDIVWTFWMFLPLFRLHPSLPLEPQILLFLTLFSTHAHWSRHTEVSISPISHNMPLNLLPLNFLSWNCFLHISTWQDS